MVTQGQHNFRIENKTKSEVMKYIQDNKLNEQQAYDLKSHWVMCRRLGK